MLKPRLENIPLQVGVIGSGIAGSSWVWAIKKLYPEVRLVQISDNEFYPACSLSSTAIVTSHGVKKGISNLGNLLFESFDFFKEQFSNSESVESGTHHHLVDEVEKRERYSHLSKHNDGHFFEDGFYINERLFLKELSTLAVKKKAVVESLEQGESKVEIQLRGGERVKFDFCFLGEGLFSTRSLKPLKPVQGSFLELKKDLGEKSFSYTLNGSNLIYKARERRLIFGSQNHKASHMLFDRNALLRNFQENFFQIFKENCEARAEDIIYKTGLRAKAPKRIPYIQQNGRIIEMNGLYKNGWSVGPYLAHKFLGLEK